MRDILEAVGTFLIALAAGFGANLAAVAYGVDTIAAGGIGTTVLLAVGIAICNRRKPKENGK